MTYPVIMVENRNGARFRARWEWIDAGPELGKRFALGIWYPGDKVTSGQAPVYVLADTACHFRRVSEEG